MLTRGRAPHCHGRHRHGRLRSVAGGWWSRAMEIEGPGGSPARVGRRSARMLRAARPVWCRRWANFLLLVASALRRLVCFEPTVEVLLDFAGPRDVNHASRTARSRVRTAGKKKLLLAGKAKCNLCWRCHPMHCPATIVYTRQTEFCLSKMHRIVGVSLM